MKNSYLNLTNRARRVYYASHALWTRTSGLKLSVRVQMRRGCNNLEAHDQKIRSKFLKIVVDVFYFGFLYGTEL